MLRSIQPITDMAQRFGFGEKTGIPLEGEPTGFVPTDAWMMQKFGHRLQGGDIANLSIGQGRTLVTPLQVAQSISLCPRGDKRFYLQNDARDEPLVVEARAYWFNDMDYHGVLPDPRFRYSVRVDGTFVPGFVEELQARVARGLRRVRVRVRLLQARGRGCGA